MESNNEMMIISLLNLYTSYVNVKKQSGNPGKKSIRNRFATIKATNVGQYIASKSINLQEHNSVPVNCHTSVNRPESAVEAIDSDKQNYIGSIPQSGNTAPQPQVNSGVITESTVKVKVKRRKRGEAKPPKEKKPRVRRWRVRPINIDRTRTGYHRKVFSNVKKMDDQQFFEHTRMSKSLYDWLLSFTRSSLRKSRQSILSEERLALTLNYLAHGPSLQSIAFKYKIGKSTARQIVLDTCGVLVNLLSPLYLSKPTTAQYVDIAEDFKKNWYIPNCVGAIDGKRLLLSNPRNKDDNALFVLAACDTKYKFSTVSVGKLNEQCDDGLFKLLKTSSVITSDDFALPSNKPLYPSSSPFPYYFISDAAFPLRKNIMHPYTEKNLDTTESIFNFKISRARSITENAFGILTARFRVLLTTIEFLPEGCKTIVLATIALHNYIMANDENHLYCPSNFVDQENLSGIIEEGEWRNVLRSNGDQPLSSMARNNNRSTDEAKNLRDVLSNYFASEAISYEIEFV